MDRLAPDSEHGRRAPPGWPGSGRRGERGGVSWVTLLLVAAVAGGGYWLWVWGPVYFENYAVKQVVRDYMNQAIKDSDDGRLVHNMVLKIRSLGERDALDGYGRPVRVPWVPHEELDEYGRTVRVPNVALDERDVTWERDMGSQPPMLRVAFEYTREVEYPWLNRSTAKVFSVDLSNDLTVPNWGPPR